MRYRLPLSKPSTASVRFRPQSTGTRRDPSDLHLASRHSMKNRITNRCRPRRVQASIVKKSAATIRSQCCVRNSFQVVFRSRSGPGSIPCRLRSRQSCHGRPHDPDCIALPGFADNPNCGFLSPCTPPDLRSPRIFSVGRIPVCQCHRISARSAGNARPSRVSGVTIVATSRRSCFQSLCPHCQSAALVIVEA